MTPINMLAWWQWLIMAAIPPLIILLYFLKLRRQPVEVPSTYLWNKAIEDLHVNSIWQRLRKNLLLLLQLLAVLALMLACLRPGYRGETELGDRVILMIDNSGSMQAEDVGSSRLSEAKTAALKMVDALASDDVAMVIAFSDRADVKQGFTSDKKKLRTAVNSIAATTRVTDLNEALRAASGLANPGRTSQIEDLNDIQVAEALPAQMYILSDGGFAAPQIDLGNLSAEYIAIGSFLPDNVGILAFTAERNLEQSDRIEAFARVQNFGSTDVRFTATLTIDGSLADAAEVDIAAGESTGVNFQLTDVGQAELMLELEIDDAFALDNQAFAGLDPPRQLDVMLVTDGNAPLEAALATPQAQSLASVRVVEPASLNSPELTQLSASGQIDLFIYDNCAPDNMPAANTLFIGTLPPAEAWSASEPTGPLFVINTNRAHPMLQYVDMGTVQIVEGVGLEIPPGGTELLRTESGVLIAVAPRGAYQDAVIGMPLMKRTSEGPLANTDWPVRRSFPVFVFNALEYLGGAVSTAGSKTIAPGQPAVLNLSSRFEKVRITDPTGKSLELNRQDQPQMIFTQTDQLGFYRAQPAESEQLLQLFTVNLFSEQESNLSVASEVRIGASQVVANNSPRDVVRIEYWRWLLAFALIVLGVEWYLYNRRVAI